MPKRALVLIDIQNDYFPGGKWTLSGIECRGGQRGEGAGGGPRGRRPGRPRPARVPDGRRAVLRAGVGRGEDPPEGQEPRRRARRR